ncbi:isoamylase early set domain-containing protein [Fibrobacterota bacterium]
MDQTKKTSRKRINFKVNTENGKKVCLAGSFNSWDQEKNRLKYRDGLYTSSLLLSPGRHEYKYVVDGEWLEDPESPESVPNAFGTRNSVVTV